jgi:hypothetical protein
MSKPGTIEFWNTLGLGRPKKEEPKAMSAEKIKEINKRIEQMALDYDLPLYELTLEPKEWQKELMAM